MGTGWSSMEQQPSPDPWWPTAQLSNTTDYEVGKEEAETMGRQQRGRVRHEELESFKQELAHKRALRHEALAALQAEMRALRSKVEEERNLRLQAEEERDRLRTSIGADLREELEREREEKKKLSEEREKLMVEAEEKSALERQVQALKDVSEIGKEMLRIRELQVKELKKKLVDINMSSVMAPPEDLRVEYEKQIENIRKLRTLYEERAAATLLEHRRELEREEAKIAVLEAKLSDLQKEAEECKEAKKELEGKIEKLESTIQHKEDELETTKDNLISSTVQNKSLNSQMTLINNLFSQMLVSPQVDLDRLTRLLKENHGLITDLTEKGDSNEVAALLVDLAGQVEKEDAENKEKEQISENSGEYNQLQSEIASNLTKVWRVMVELLSHHQNSGHTELAGGAESCYKCIQTPNGPRSVISVSQTFLTLKDLILEKNRLVKEVGRLKTLNNHLEHRLGSQEKRLSVVTTELRKTWGVVNKLRAQHKQLHTHEKILRYELQQKRCMLTELRQELDHCRDKWERARQKNSQTEEDWKKLRKEFAARKSRKESNSAESGYEEEDLAQSPPSEPVSHGQDLFEIKPSDGSETELSEEEIEHSDGNSFDTVIDLLDIACLENQPESESEIPFVLREIPHQTSDISQSLLPLTGSEFTEGLDQIESEDLAAVLDIQYQNQLIGADYNLSLPSSSGSSPIPTENDDFASSEMDISEEDSSSNDNHVYATPLPNVNQPVPETTLLFGSNSSKNISKFLDGLFVDQQQNNQDKTDTPHKLFLDVPSTSQRDENDSTTPIVHNENCYQFSTDTTTPLINNENCYEFPVDNNGQPLEQKSEKAKVTGLEHVQQWVTESQSLSTKNIKNEDSSGSGESKTSDSSCESEPKTQEELLMVREERLKKLEQQCRSLVSKVTSTSFRSEIISTKLDELHLNYGSSGEVSDIDEESVSKIKCEKDQEPQQSSTNQMFEANTSDTELAPSKCSTTSETSKDEIGETAYLLENEQPNQSSSSVKVKTPQEILEARAARLKRLEDQCKSLFSKMSATSSRSDLISNKLDELHESYGPSEQKVELEKSIMSKATNHLSTDKNKQHNIENISLITNPLTPSNEEKDLKSPDLVSESKEILNKCSLPGPSLEIIEISPGSPKKDRTPEEILEARAERFKRLEEQCKSLVSKMTATSLRSEIISNKLDELHSCYGSSEDASDNDEHSSSPKDSSRRKSTPTSSPRHNRKMLHAAEKDKENGVTETHNNISIIGETAFERLNPDSINLETEGTNQTKCTESTDKSKRTPEEILQARAQRLNRLEEQCKSLFSKMSATSQRSDVLSNRLEELHEQYGQPSTHDSTQSSQSSSTVGQNLSSNTSSNIEVLRLEGDKEEKNSQPLNASQPHKETNSIMKNSITEKLSQQNGDKSD